MTTQLTDDQRKGLERTLGGAIALVDWLIARHKLSRVSIADYCEAARVLLIKNEEESSDETRRS